MIECCLIVKFLDCILCYVNIEIFINRIIYDYGVIYSIKSLFLYCYLGFLYKFC